MTLMLILVVVVALVSAGLGYRQRRRRSGELQEWAAAEGWTYADRDPSVRSVPCAPAERRATERHVLRGVARDGRHVVAFESEYRVQDSGSSDGSGGGTSAVVHAVVATTVVPSVPGGNPMVQVSPYSGVRFLRSVGRDRRAVVTGRQDFDDRFDLLTDHPGAAATTVGPAVLDWLVADPRMRTTSFRLQGDALVLWHRGRLTPQTLGFLLDLATELRGRLGQEGYRLAG
jgi:hypothetical protein